MTHPTVSAHVEAAQAEVRQALVEINSAILHSLGNGSVDPDLRAAESHLRDGFRSLGGVGKP